MWLILLSLAFRGTLSCGNASRNEENSSGIAHDDGYTGAFEDNFLEDYDECKVIQ
jgi:hypothetical protein